MKNFIIILLLALLLASCGSGVPVMDGPSETAAQLDTISPNTAYTILLMASDDWALIEYFSGDHKKTGFIKQ